MYIFIFILLVWQALSAESVKTQGQTDVLYMGESTRLPTAGAKKVTVSNSKVIKVTKGGKDELLVTAKAAGNSGVNIWYKDGHFQNYRYSVISSEVFKRLQSIRQALSGIKTIKVTNAGDSIYIMGTADSKTDLELIAKVSASHSKTMNYVKASSDVQFGINKKTAQALSEIGVYDISVINPDGMVLIEGKVRDKKTQENAEAYIKANNPNARYDIRLVPYQVDIDVKILEVTKTGMFRFGLEPPSEVSVTRHTVFSRIELDSILHFEENNGTAKLLANPSLSANDNETAEFHAGGELPIKLSSRYMSKMTWKEYGIILKFTPKVVSDETVELNIVSEFSTVDDSRKIEDIPGFLVRKVNTIVTIDSGKTVVISGLIHKSNSSNVKGIPIISDIPLLSSLFSYNSEDEKDSELTIIVSPDIRFRCEGMYVDNKLETLLLETLSEEIKVNK